MPSLDELLTPRKVQRYGWRPDSLDRRDHLLAVRPAAVLPVEVDLEPQMPGVYDQLQIGSCTANAIAALLEYRHLREGGTPLTPSRLFIYYCERVLEHTTKEDAGAEIRDGLKVVSKTGAPPESDWPYVDDGKTFAKRPPAKAYKDGKVFKALAYARVPQAQLALQTILAEGTPVAFGFTVYASFESQSVAVTGIVPMPAGEAILGGHAVALVGYKTISGQLYFKVRNSWGPGWGLGGYFYMPAAFVLDASLSSDFWCVTAVTAPHA